MGKIYFVKVWENEKLNIFVVFGLKCSFFDFVYAYNQLTTIILFDISPNHSFCFPFYDHLASLKVIHFLWNCILSDLTYALTFDKEDHFVLTKHLNDRLALLCGGVSIIYVGADTDVELKEKQDRVDDAVHAVKAARKEGILPGGGAALAFIAQDDWEMELNQGMLAGVEILKNALVVPFTKILENAGLDPASYPLSEWGMGVGVTCGCKKVMIESGIIDPLLVTKSALNNAISVAATILSTDCVISNVRE